MTAGSFTLHGRFPAGTVVGIYPQGTNVPTGAPQSAATATATVAGDGSLALSGLTVGTSYYATEKPQSAVQSLKIDATSGNFRLRYGGYTTPALKFNITAANLKTAIQALTSIGSGQIATVTGGPGDSGGTTPYVITFGGTLDNQAIAPLEVVSGVAADASTALVTLTGGGAAGTLTVTTVGATGGLHWIGFTPDPS